MGWRLILPFDLLLQWLSSWFSIDRILQPVVLSDALHLFVRIHSFLATSRSRGECTHPKWIGFPTIRKLFKSLPLLQYILKTFDRSGTVLCGLRLLMIVESELSER